MNKSDDHQEQACVDRYSSVPVHIMCVRQTIVSSSTGVCIVEPARSLSLPPRPSYIIIDIFLPTFQYAEP